MINSYYGVGIELDGDGILIQGCYIGTNAAGTSGSGRANNGVIVRSSNNTIGGTALGAGNLISGNSFSGIFIPYFDTTSPNLRATGNVVLGNRIGTNAAGTGEISNTYGVQIDNASENTIGGTSAAAGNLISGNSEGVYINGSEAVDNVIEGNRLGTDPAGVSAIPNFYGVAIFGGTANTIGGTNAGAGNLISGNTYGVDLNGVGVNDNVVAGDLIGTDVSGTFAVPNTSAGVLIENGASSNLIGGTDSGAGNLISGNPKGVEIDGPGASGNLIIGNRVGTDATGSSALILDANTNGIYLNNASENTIGGTAPGAGNVISGLGRGIFVYGPSATNNLIEGNRIGTNASGTTIVANFDGVDVFSGADNTIGGTAPGAGNLVSGNDIAVIIEEADATGNLVAGNRLGTDVTGTIALPERRRRADL